MNAENCTRNFQVLPQKIADFEMTRLEIVLEFEHNDSPSVISSTKVFSNLRCKVLLKSLIIIPLAPKEM